MPEAIRICRTRCNLLVCPHCSYAKAARLVSEADRRWRELDVHSVGMLTLTLDDRLVPGNVLVKLQTVRERRVVAEAAALFATLTSTSGRYLCRMEFGESSGRLHFHMVLDGGGMMSKAQLKRLQSWCRERIGTCHYEFAKGDDRRANVLRYVTKYIAKAGDVPDLLLDRARIKWTTTSHGYWARLREPGKHTGERKKARTLRVRLQECGQQTVILDEEVGPGGVLKLRYRGRIDRPLVQCLADLGDLVNWREGTMWSAAGKAIGYVFSVAEWEEAERRFRTSDVRHRTDPAGECPPVGPAGEAGLDLSPPVCLREGLAG